MWQHFVQALKQKGYTQAYKNEPYILIRKSETECYVLFLVQSAPLASGLEQKRQAVERDLITQGAARCYHLCVILKKTALFESADLELVEQMPNVWLFAEDQKRMYRYENQPMEWDGVCQMMEEMPDTKRKDLGARRRRVPWITIALVVVNILLFVVPYIMGVYEELLELGMNQRELVLRKQEYYRLFTHMFLHGDWNHLLNNMTVLLVLGTCLESALGRWKYTVIYLISGLCGGLCSIWLHPAAVGSIGASGAIFGLSGALLALVLFWKGKIPGISLRRVVIMCVASLYGGLTAVNVDNAAHIGGMLAGFILVIITNLLRENYT